MNGKRLVTTAIFSGLMGGAFLGTAQIDTIKEVSKGVWFRQGDLTGKGHCNNTVIEMKDYLVIVDANFPSGAQMLLADLKKISSKPVKYVFDTHHHGDHAYANAVWTKLGATTIAHANVAAEMKAREPQRWLSAGKEREDVRALNLPTAEPPKETFTKSPHVITDGVRRIELHHFGWAHTKGDGFVFLPAEKIIATGDAVVNGPYNFTADGHVGNWPNVVKGAQKLGATMVLPGHGPHGGVEILAGELAFLTELRNAVMAARKSGKKLEDLVTMKDGQPVKSSLALPAAVKNWVGDFFPAQVFDTWKELEAGKPRGDLNL